MPSSSIIKTVKQKSSSRRNLISKITSVNSNDFTDIILTPNEKYEQSIIKELLSNPKRSRNEDDIRLEKAVEEKEKHEKDEASKHEHEEWDDVTLKEENKGVKNDYCQHFVDTAQRPQNFIRDAGLADRFEEYPKLRELIKLKDELIFKTNLPPMYLKYDFDVKNTDVKLSNLLECEFDVILVEPPLEDYKRTNGVCFNKYMSWDEIKELDLENIASQRSFIFLWCGSADGLDKGRECLKKWGFRRCEDICWIKTNRLFAKHNRNLEPNAIFQRTKEHCLMGIKGTVRRSVDSDFIHANVDIDLIITDEPEYGNPDKPEEIFNIIEHFCLGKRRLYLFGRDSTIRDGWLTIGTDLSYSNFDKEKYKSWFELPNSTITGCTDRIDMLRPKSPPMKTKLLPQAPQPQPMIYNSTNMMNQPEMIPFLSHSSPPQQSPQSQQVTPPQSQTHTPPQVQSQNLSF